MGEKVLVPCISNCFSSHLLASEQRETSDWLTPSCHGQSRVWAARTGGCVPSEEAASPHTLLCLDLACPPSLAGIKNPIDLCGAYGSFMA